METGYEAEQMSNATCTRFSHLQVGAVMQTGLQEEDSWTKPVHNSLKLLHIPFQCTSQYPTPIHQTILFTGILAVKSALGWLAGRIRAGEE